jgi:hypothetical protein
LNNAQTGEAKYGELARPAQHIAGFVAVGKAFEAQSHNASEFLSAVQGTEVRAETTRFNARIVKRHFIVTEGSRKHSY